MPKPSARLTVIVPRQETERGVTVHKATYSIVQALALLAVVTVGFCFLIYSLFTEQCEMGFSII